MYKFFLFFYFSLVSFIPLGGASPSLSSGGESKDHTPMQTDRPENMLGTKRNLDAAGWEDCLLGDDDQNPSKRARKDAKSAAAMEDVAESDSDDDDDDITADDIAKVFITLLRLEKEILDLIYKLVDAEDEKFKAIANMLIEKLTALDDFWDEHDEIIHRLTTHRQELSAAQACRLLHEKFKIQDLQGLLITLELHTEMSASTAEDKDDQHEYRQDIKTVLNRMEEWEVVKCLRKQFLLCAEDEDKKQCFLMLTEEDAPNMYKTVTAFMQKLGLKCPVILRVWLNPTDDYPAEHTFISGVHYITFHKDHFPDLASLKESIAHELGHALQAEKGITYAYYWDIEIDADAIGSYLLSPEIFIQRFNRLLKTKPSQDEEDAMMIFYRLGTLAQDARPLLLKFWPEWAMLEIVHDDHEYEQLQLLLAEDLHTAESYQISEDLKSAHDRFYLHPPHVKSIAELAPDRLQERLAKFDLKLESPART